MIQPDPNPPPGAPENFPVRCIAQSGVQLVYAPPYTRGDPNYLIDRGIGIKLRKPQTWIDKHGNTQTWDENWEKRYPLWDSSFAGLFELFEVGLEKRLQWKFNMIDYDPPSPSPPNSVSGGSPEPRIVRSDFIWTYPKQGMPFNQPITKDQMIWIRSLTLDPPLPDTHPEPPLSFLLHARVIQATDLLPGVVVQDDPEIFGPLGDKVTILLPEWDTSEPSHSARHGHHEDSGEDDDNINVTLLQLKQGGHYTPTNPSLYERTERAFGFEWRTRLAMTGPGFGMYCGDPNHSYRKVKYDNLWFLQLDADEMPTFHFWVDPNDRPAIEAQMAELRARLSLTGNGTVTATTLSANIAPSYSSPPPSASASPSPSAPAPPSSSPPSPSSTQIQPHDVISLRTRTVPRTRLPSSKKSKQNPAM